MPTTIHSPSRTVPPSRFATGTWSHDLNRQIGEGDIHASYSADRIGMGQPIRRPFPHEGFRWVCVGFGPGPVAQAYRLVHLSAFGGSPTTYADKVRPNGGSDARSDPMGFYHGMAVRPAARNWSSAARRCPLCPASSRSSRCSAERL